MRKAWFDRLTAAIAMTCVLTFGAALLPCPAALAHNERAPRREVAVKVVKRPHAVPGQAFSETEKQALAESEAENRALENYEGGAALVIGISGGVLLLIALVVLLVVLID